MDKCRYFDIFKFFKKLSVPITSFGEHAKSANQEQKGLLFYFTFRTIIFNLQMLFPVLNINLDTFSGFTTSQGREHSFDGLGRKIFDEGGHGNRFPIHL